MSWASPPDVTPSGVIMSLNSSVSNVPEGWVVCDGNNNTPNLRDKFPRSTDSATEVPGDTVGSHSYTLSTSQMASHSHGGSTDSVGSHTHGGDWEEDWEDEDHAGNKVTYLGNNSSPNTGGAGGHSHGNISVYNSGSGNSIDNRPQFVETLFIKKI